MPALPVRLIAIAALGAIACGRDASAQPSTCQLPATPANGGAVATQSTDGNALVARMLAGMERNVSLTAKVRQRIWLGDRETQGEGQYWHQSVDNQRRSRWQLRTLAGGETVSLVQVFDRRYVWTERRMGENRKVSRIDIDTLRREMLTRAETAGEAALGVSPQQATLLARGGISQLLADLQRRFDFGPPRPALVGERDNQRETLAVVGVWKPAELTRLWQGVPYDPAAPPAWPLDQWPEQLPHHVVIHCGRKNMFPYLIEYRSAGDAAAATAVNAVASVARPLARYEFFEERFAAVMDPQLFQYDPGEVDWVDETGKMLASLLPLEVQEPEEETALRRRVVR